MDSEPPEGLDSAPRPASLEVGYVEQAWPQRNSGCPLQGCRCAGQGAWGGGSKQQGEGGEEALKGQRSAISLPWL